jgi:hypothetical protein
MATIRSPAEKRMVQETDEAAPGFAPELRLKFRGCEHGVLESRIDLAALLSCSAMAAVSFRLTAHLNPVGKAWYLTWNEK